MLNVQNFKINGKFLTIRKLSLTITKIGTKKIKYSLTIKKNIKKKFKKRKRTINKFYLWGVRNARLVKFYITVRLHLMAFICGYDIVGFVCNNNGFCDCELRVWILYETNSYSYNSGWTDYELYSKYLIEFTWERHR